jgi:AcrR family transcriptional regulator
MPTGVPNAAIREQLFDAAERVLLRDGPGRLTSRAVTSEAGVAKGMLHRHFPDFDAFLVAAVLEHLERLDAQSAELRASAGTGGLDENLASALSEALSPVAIRIIGLICCRRLLLERLRLTTPTGIPLLAETTKMITTYLTAERGLGRIALATDVDTLAVMLVGGAYLLTAPDGGASNYLRDLVRPVLQSVDLRIP